MSKPDKTLKVGGHARAGIDSDTDQLIITPEGGLVVVSICDLDGIVMWMHHPLSGWYIEADMRTQSTTESEGQ